MLLDFTVSGLGVPAQVCVEYTFYDTANNQDIIVCKIMPITHVFLSMTGCKQKPNKYSFRFNITDGDKANHLFIGPYRTFDDMEKGFESLKNVIKQIVKKGSTSAKWNFAKHTDDYE